jgi:hypothetical protein
MPALPKSPPRCARHCDCVAPGFSGHDEPGESATAITAATAPGIA